MMISVASLILSPLFISAALRHIRNYSCLSLRSLCARASLPEILRVGGRFHGKHFLSLAPWFETPAHPHSNTYSRTLRLLPAARTDRDRRDSRSFPSQD